METFLQSKEVKIPKPTLNQANKVQIDFKSTFARSLSNNNREVEEMLKLNFNSDDVQTINKNKSDCKKIDDCDKKNNNKNMNKISENLIIDYSDESYNRSDEDKLLWTVDQQVVKEDIFDLIYIPHFFSFFFPFLFALSHDPNKNSFFFLETKNLYFFFCMIKKILNASFKLNLIVSFLHITHSL